MVQEGEKAPDFSAETTGGARLTLGDFVGKRPLILYFYPKDNTTGCTKEACAFRDMSSEIEAAGGAVVGVSNDSPDSHERFKAQYRLNFPLLSDSEGTLAKAYGVARLTGILGGALSKWIPPRRVTFVIDRLGIVRRVIESEFHMDDHVDGAVAALRELSS